MILIGLAVWLAIAGFYVGVTWAAVAAFAVALIRCASPRVTRGLFALVCALAVAPVGCTLLYVPVQGKAGVSDVRDPGTALIARETVKPRYLDSLELSYALSFALVGLAAWLACGLAMRLAVSRRS